MGPWGGRRNEKQASKQASKQEQAKKNFIFSVAVSGTLEDWHFLLKFVLLVFGAEAGTKIQARYSWGLEEHSPTADHSRNPQVLLLELVWACIAPQVLRVSCSSKVQVLPELKFILKAVATPQQILCLCGSREDLLWKVS